MSQSMEMIEGEGGGSGGLSSGESQIPPGGVAPDPSAGESGPEDREGEAHPEDPDTSGTLFVMILFLIAIAALWGLMYLVLLER